MKVYEITVDNAYIFYSHIDEIDFEKAILQVSDLRREKALKLRRIEDRKLSVMSELLLLYGLEKLGVSCKLPLEFAVNNYGKPYISGLKDWYFNISHSGDIAICAISRNEIGIDIEDVSRDCSKIADKYFTENEQYIAKENGTSYIWTRKEAVVKADGRGLGVGVDKIDTSGDTVTVGEKAYRLVTTRVENCYFSLAW